MTPSKRRPQWVHFDGGPLDGKRHILISSRAGLVEAPFVPPSLQGMIGPRGWEIHEYRITTPPGTSPARASWVRLVCTRMADPPAGPPGAGGNWGGSSSAGA